MSMKQGTIVDATIISLPSSTSTRAKPKYGDLQENCHSWAATQAA